MNTNGRRRLIVCWVCAVYRSARNSTWEFYYIQNYTAVANSRAKGQMLGGEICVRLSCYFIESYSGDLSKRYNRNEAVSRRSFWSVSYFSRGDLLSSERRKFLDQQVWKRKRSGSISFEEQSDFFRFWHFTAVNGEI